MSGTETERKYLVRRGSAAYRGAAFAYSDIRQGYIPAEGCTVRVRTRDSSAWLTIKSHSRDGGLSRYEFETEITPDEAAHLLALCRGGVVEKRRYLVRCPDGRHTLEVDEFAGDNEGLVMAEVELAEPGEACELPPFVGPEVTGDRRYYNSQLLLRPYRLWRHEVDEAYR